VSYVFAWRNVNQWLASNTFACRGQIPIINRICVRGACVSRGPRWRHTSCRAGRPVVILMCTWLRNTAVQCTGDRRRTCVRFLLTFHEVLRDDSSNRRLERQTGRAGCIHLTNSSLQCGGITGFLQSRQSNSATGQVQPTLFKTRSGNNVLRVKYSVFWTQRLWPGTGRWRRGWRARAWPSA
jgi:hypothetical protein